MWEIYGGFKGIIFCNNGKVVKNAWEICGIIFCNNGKIIKNGCEIYGTKERLVDDHYEFVTHPIV